MQKDFELPSLFNTSSQSELLSNNDLSTWFVFWVCILKSLLLKSRWKAFCNTCFFHFATFEMSLKTGFLNKI